MISFQTHSQRVLVIIPAYNEQASIRWVVNLVRKTVPRADVLVIDDGSTDDTLRQARLAGAFVVRHPFNLGIGGAVQTGLKFARQEDYDVVMRLDGDGQHDPHDILTFLASVRSQRADVVIGSRFLHPLGDVRLPVLRLLGVRLFALEVRLLTGAPATDTTSGLMGMNRRAVEVLVNHIPQDYPEVESRILLHKAGLTTLELPTRMHARRAGVSSINSWRSIYYAFKVTLAVLVAAIKDTPVLTTEIPDARADRAALHSYSLQPHLGGRDRAVDP
ncbi:MAG: glycosyltransferase family 2 protein [Ardenticatenaceae bacterium]|nr:glycosyltransferase family 2 protein [Ardenticatenaceae bacterium]